MRLNERVAIISEENINKLSCLYGGMDIDGLSRIVNNHLKVAMDEIEEDCSKQKKPCCSGCGYMRMYDHGTRIYCCDHKDRTDDMGKLSMENLIETSPKWCPLRDKENNMFTTAAGKESY